MSEPKIIAVAGKGGVGKTSCSAVMVKLLCEAFPDKKILAIDADPAVGLSTALGIEVETTIDDIRREFGDRIASLVQIESVADDEGTWHERKKKAIDMIANAPLDAKIVAMGDKLSNMRAIARDYEVQGDALWKLFHASDPKDHEWHYRGLADALRDLKDTFAFKEFEQLIDRVFSGK